MARIWFIRLLCLAVVLLVVRVVVGDSSFAGWEHASKYPVEHTGGSAVSYNGELYFPGTLYSSDFVQDDPIFDRIWVLNADTLEWRWVMSFGSIPPRRSFYCTVLIEAKMYLFGGTKMGNDMYQNDMYALDLRTMQWENLTQSSATVPSPRVYMSCSAYKNERIYLFGGISTSRFNDLWEYSTGSKKWNLINPSAEELGNIPAKRDTYMVVYHDSLFVVGGLISNVSYYSMSLVLWRFDISNGSMKWESPISIANEYLFRGIASVSLGNKCIYILGEINDNQGNIYSITLVVYLETYETSEVLASLPNYQNGYPIDAPSPRSYAISASLGDKYFVSGGFSACAQNDVWVFDGVSKKWVDSSLSRYPLGRTNPHITKIDENNVSIFGGTVCHAEFQPINDLWLLNTRSSTWKRISQESVCHPSRGDCAPAVINAAFSYWKDSFFLMGGFYDGYDSPILKKYSITTGRWSNMNVSSSFFMDVGTRYLSANTVIGNKMFMWGGINVNGTIPLSSVYVYDFENDKENVYPDASDGPQMRQSTNGVLINGKFCFSDTYTHEPPSGAREVWCWDDDAKKWNIVTIYPMGISGGFIFGHLSNMIIFGGFDRWTLSSDTWMGNLNSTYWAKLPSMSQTAPSRTGSSVSIVQNTMYIYGGTIEYAYSTNGLYKLDLDKIWCTGTQYFTENAGRITDGSGEFLYFPGTNCSWIITKANFIVVDYVDITTGATLIIRPTNECGVGFKFNNKTYDELSLAYMKPGDVIEVVSGQTQIYFQVESKAPTSSGFSVQLFSCKLGFYATSGGCECKKGNYINFRGECVPCDSYYSGLESNECPNFSPFSEMQEINVIEGMDQTEMNEISEGLPPVVYANAFIVDDNIYLVGGSSSPDIQQTQNFYPMNQLFFTNSLANSVWLKMEASGPIPSSRVQSCVISMDSYAVLIGGRTEGLDKSVYFFHPSTKSWEKKKNTPSSIIGAGCERNDNAIYIYGGEDAFIYYPDTDVWKEIQTAIQSSYMRTFGSLVTIGMNRIIFGGRDIKGESESMIQMDKDMKPKYQTEVNPDDCIRCDEEKWICLFGREHFSFSRYKNELHVFGGTRKGEILNDILILDFDSLTVVYRENYGLFSPELPLVQPPPKFGSAHVTHGSRFMMIGGASSLKNAGNDVWVWDTDTSIIREPINRKEAGFSKIDENSFVIFGGSTQYNSEVLLNDVWIFDIGKRKWSMLFAGSSTVGPSPRAGSAISVLSSDIYVSGGRTDIAVLDENIWIFHTQTKKWETKILSSQLSMFQRPLNRYGIASAQLGKALWMWGGQIPPGSKKAEFYSATIKLDIENNQIISELMSIDTPSRRTYHTMCAIGSSNITMYGGSDMNGAPMNDHWVYNTDSKLWKQMSYKSSEKSPHISNHICATYRGYTILNGIGEDKNNIYWMQQHEFERQTRVYVSNPIRNYRGVHGHAGDFFYGAMVSFGGLNGYSTTNQVFAYKPGFCSSSKPQIMVSGLAPQTFDDGSGEGMYLENSNCTWLLPNATHIIMESTLRKGDWIGIEFISKGARQVWHHHMEGSGIYERRILTSENGFKIQFFSNGDASSIQPCEGCEGFTATHFGCPANSDLNQVSMRCECYDGYYLGDNDSICIKETKEVGQMWFVIGGSLGGFSIFAMALAFWFRRKILLDLASAKNKLIGLINPDEIVFGDAIGKGSFGEVYKGEYRGITVAIKKIPDSEISKEALNIFKNEISLMIELRHPHIVLYMGACFDESYVGIICEFMKNGSLFDVLHDENRTISREQRIQFMMDICKGMQYLHMSNPPIIHRDLKSPNILVDDYFRLKVCDFGLTFFKGKGEKKEPFGSIFWMAPEAIVGEEYKESSDVYSFGIIVWEIMTRRQPYDDVDSIYALPAKIVMEEKRPDITEDIPSEISSIIKNAWDQNPQKRPNFVRLSKEIIELAESDPEASNVTHSSNLPEIKPQGDVAVVHTSIFGSEKLWEDISLSMYEAVMAHNRILRQACYRARGYISRSDLDQFVIVFQETIDALRFCLETQVELQEHGWSDKILDHENAREILNGSLKGLRVKMGVSYGTCTMTLEENPSRYEYRGKVVSSSLELKQEAFGGQILLNEAAHQSLGKNATELQKIGFIRPFISASRIGRALVYEAYHITMKRRAENMIPSVDNRGAKRCLAETSSSLEIPNVPESNNDYINSWTQQNSTDKLRGIKNITEEYGSSWRVSYSELGISSHVLGHGSYGSVHVAFFKGAKVAVKVVNGNPGRDQTNIGFMAEISILRKLKHPNIIQFIGACTDPGHLAMVTELIEPGNLRQYLRVPTNPLSPQNKKQIIEGIVNGMGYLHTQNPVILHRDLKSANILITADFVAKICDFGFARVRANTKTMTKCGTTAYQAPEILRGEKYNEKADVYSFAIVLWEIENRRNPFPDQSVFTIQIETMKGLRPVIPRNMNPGIERLMRLCWENDPSARPSFSEIRSSFLDTI